MATVDVGEAITRTVQLSNAAGVAVDADTLPTYAVTLPDGSAGVAPAVTHGATGEYFVNYTTTVSGPHFDTWTATVAGLPVRFGPDMFRVRAGTAPPLLGLAEARTLLGIGSDPARDERVREYVEAATELCEDHAGRAFRRRTVVEAHDGGRDVLRLRITPVQSITTVTESGTSVAGSGWFLDAFGLLFRGTTAGVWAWQSGVRNVTVTYVAGMTAPKARTVQAVRVTLQHLWSTQGGASGGPRRSTGTNVSEYAPGAAWSLPRAAEELLAPDMMPGIG